MYNEKYVTGIKQLAQLVPCPPFLPIGISTYNSKYNLNVNFIYRKTYYCHRT